MLLTADGVRDLLRTRLMEYGGEQQQFARELGVSPQYLSDVLHRRREPGDAILRGLGVERVVLYRPSRPQQ